MFQIHQISKELIDNEYTLSPKIKCSIDHILARYAAANGLPGTESHRRKRDSQSLQIKGILYEDISKLLVNKLKGLPQSAGLQHKEAYLEDIVSPEGDRQSIPKFDSEWMDNSPGGE
ncbi:MAG: hypothetical protein HRU19_32640 [Pseudobacteriovorax sp.]|nr:hypothetical protein [Pseudobacteriovorax sp.]